MGRRVTARIDLHSVAVYAKRKRDICKNLAVLVIDDPIPISIHYANSKIGSAIIYEITAKSAFRFEAEIRCRTVVEKSKVRCQASVWSEPVSAGDHDEGRLRGLCYAQIVIRQGIFDLTAAVLIVPNPGDRCAITRGLKLYDELNGMIRLIIEQPGIVAEINRVLPA